MANPTLGWDRVPVFGWWSTNPGVPADGTIELFVGERIRRVDGRMIYPGGAKRRVKIGDRDAQDADIRDAVRTAMRAVAQVEEGGDFDASEWDLRWDKNLDAAIFTSFWASDDPDITPQGYQVRVTESLTSAVGRVYYIEPVIADLDKAVPGQNLGMIEVPPGSPTVPAPIYAKGQRGGVAALDSVTGNVLDADGNEVGAIDVGAIDQAVEDYLIDNPPASGATTWTELDEKPSEFPPEAHSHTTGDVTGLDSTLSGKASTGDVDQALTDAKQYTDDELEGLSTGGEPTSWGSVTGKPSTFPPATHTHTRGQVSDASALGRTLMGVTDPAAGRAALEVTAGGGGSGIALDEDGTPYFTIGA